MTTERRPRMRDAGSGASSATHRASTSLLTPCRGASGASHRGVSGQLSGGAIPPDRAVGALGQGLPLSGHTAQSLRAARRTVEISGTHEGYAL
jgi:hypothetical protein